MLQVLTIVASLFFLVFGTIPYSPCLASKSKNDLDNFEPSKKRQRIAALSPALSPCLLEFNQFNSLAEELIMQIFDHLSFHQLSKVKMVCKEWQRISTDDFFSLSKQINSKPLYVLLDKLKESKNGQDGLYQEFFTSPDGLQKLLLDSTALEDILTTPSLIPLFFKSQVTAATIYEALHRPTLKSNQQAALEDYTKAAPLFSSKESIFSPVFVEFTSTYAAPYKALYLLVLFNLPSGKPIKDLLKRVNQEIGSEEIYHDKMENEAILLPRAMAFFPNLPRKKAYNIAEYCYEWSQSATTTLKEEWLNLTELFFHEAARQGDIDAQLKLSEVLDEQGKFDDSEYILLFLANQGNSNAQFTLASHYDYQNKTAKAESYYRLAATQGDPEAQYYLGVLLQNQDKMDEAEIYYNKAAIQGYVPAQNDLGCCLEKKGDLLGALKNYESAAAASHSPACLNLACLLEKHTNLFRGSQEERLKKIVHLRDQGNVLPDAW